ncbi:MAG: PBP1A family penicillin-binding protein [Pseudomonadota bacterium]
MLHTAFVGVIAGGLLLAVTLAHVSQDLPRPEAVPLAETAPRIVLIGRDGERLASRGSGAAGFVDVGALPPHVVDAVIAIEDRRFYAHGGIDSLGILRALVVNIRKGRIEQGGSTLTQQLAKNLFLTPDRTVKRKLQEMMLARWLEHRYTKEEILGLYLGRVYYGAGAYGIEAAARRYFSKPAAQLTVPEAAMLAGLLKAPSLYAPTSNPAGAQARMALVLNAMVQTGMIEPIEADLALDETKDLLPRAQGNELGYFMDWVQAQTAEVLGAVDRDLTVHTTLDPVLQQAAERAVARTMVGKANPGRAQEAALFVLGTDGAVRAMVGGRAYRQSAFNRAVSAKRQPGSAFKPFVYMAAVEAGASPFDRQVDEPVDIGGWRPRNFEDTYRGAISLTQALAVSSNAIAVRLTDQVGPPRVVEAARRMGIVSPLSAHRSLPLGTEEVSLLELTAAYVPFANGGLRVEPHGVTSVTSETGKALFVRKPLKPERVLAERVVGELNYMLSAAMDYGTGKSARVDGVPGQAGKTGTSQNSRDAWFIGYTSDFVAGVWVGNDDNSPVEGMTGEGKTA